MRFVRVAAVVAAVLAVGSCGGDDDRPGSIPTGPLVEGVTVEVDSDDNVFEPLDVEVAAGTEVVWVNVGSNNHNVILSESKDILVATPDFEPGATGTYRFTEPGTFDYYCSLHGTPGNGMIGTITVVPTPVQP